MKIFYKDHFGGIDLKIDIFPFYFCYAKQPDSEVNYFFPIYLQNHIFKKLFIKRTLSVSIKWVPF